MDIFQLHQSLYADCHFRRRAQRIYRLPQARHPQERPLRVQPSHRLQTQQLPRLLPEPIDIDRLFVPVMS